MSAPGFPKWIADLHEVIDASVHTATVCKECDDVRDWLANASKALDILSRVEALAENTDRASGTAGSS